MKLASLKAESRDGSLCIVSRDLSCAIEVKEIAPNLQFALDNWQNKQADLEQIYLQLNNGKCAQAFPFNPEEFESPLPRAYQWIDGSAYVNHVELVRKARGATMPENFWTDPLMYQGASDQFIGPRDPIEAISEDHGIDFEAEVAIITDDVLMGIDLANARDHIKLITLVNDVSLRNLIPAEMAKGFGFFHSKPASSFAPVAVTPDELGLAWDGSTVQLALTSFINNEIFGQPNAGIDMTFDFPTLIEHAAKTRHLSAGTILGSGTVSNIDRSTGSSCLAERRMLEIIEHGEPSTPFLRFGDQVRIEMFDDAGKSIFGAIDQRVVPYHFS